MKSQLSTRSKNPTWTVKDVATRTRDYLNIFYLKSGIHGFFYFAYGLLHIFERLILSNDNFNKSYTFYTFRRIIWLIIITAAFVICVVLSLQSFNRYKYASTVVTIERDHFYWNITLPSLTVCPLTERLNRSYFDDYADSL